MRKIHVTIPCFTAIILLIAIGVNAQSYRLKAFSHGYMQAAAYQANDTNSYFYSNGRGSANVQVISMNNNIGNPEPVGHILADSMVSYFVTTANPPMFKERQTQNFDALGRPVFLQIHSPVNFPSPVNVKASTTYYGTGNNIKTITTEHLNSSNAWYISSVDSFEYDVNNNLLRILRKERTNNVLMDELETLYIYSNGLLINQQLKEYNNTTNAWVLKDDWNHYYNGSSMLVKTVHFTSSPNWRITDTFSNATLVQSLTEVWNTSMSAYAPLRKTDFVYGSNLLTEKLNQQYSNSNWVNLGKEVSVYSNNNEIERYILSWSTSTSSFDTVRTQYKTYNPGNLLTEFKQYWHGSSPPVIDSIYRLYYESYNPLGIATETVNWDLKIYPVPANSILNVEIPGNVPGNRQLSIHDMSGRLLRQYNVANGNRVSLPVNDLVAGQYMITVCSGGAKVTERFTVID
jgi:hypothetical protein